MMNYINYEEFSRRYEAKEIIDAVWKLNMQILRFIESKLKKKDLMECIKNCDYEKRGKYRCGVVIWLGYFAEEFILDE